MSYKALLFCPDEKTSRLVTQVLSELDFIVERAGETFATVKKLSNEHFDALIVDIENEQDASLVFKGARSSSSNHSSLYVAVVEAQAGVAKAFRIGANLVLTKPINIEQSKSTLRVARGLLRKNEAKPQTAAIPASPKLENSIPAPAPKPILAEPPSSPMPAAFAMLARDEEPAQAAAEVAGFESMPQPMAAKATPAQPSWALAKTSAEPIAATSGHAAAAAPAPEKPVPELKSAPPLATQESITSDPTMPEAFPESPSVPTLVSYAHRPNRKSSGNKLKVLAALLVLGAAAYWASQKPQFARYLPSLQKLQPTAPPQQKKPESTPSQDPDPAPSQTPLAPAGRSTPAGAALDQGTVAAPAPVPFHLVPDHYSPPEVIQVEEAPADSHSQITITPKPIVVSTKPGSAAVQKPAQLTAPPVVEITSNNSQNALAEIVASADAVVPKRAPSSVHISQGVSQGLLLKKVSPVYPPRALQLRKEGAVDLLAVISKEGTISRVRVLNGDSMLAQSAVDAVRQWKYRPYLLNGDPVEIQTQITINFRLPR